MKKNFYFLFLVCIYMFLYVSGYAQTKAVITIDEATETEEGVLVINYSIKNYKSNELFDIEIKVTKGNETIKVETVSGYVGKNIEVDTEIIVTLDGEWSDPKLEQNDRVNIIYVGKTVGQRAAVTVADQPRGAGAEIRGTTCRVPDDRDQPVQHRTDRNQRRRAIA